MIPERKVESASLRAFRDWLVSQHSSYTEKADKLTRSQLF
jgi:hypothetical protein